ncbi:MAG: CoA transferase [Streptosporangiales bacterium]|nr:CoA transferase [Streptosporangiales bacterium]
MVLPLDGFRVLDLTRFLSGPYCTMVLADLGADVVKIEKFPEGDESRRYSPKINGESYPYTMPNRGKRSLGLDLKAEHGREIFLRLARDADLVIENFRPGVAARLGVDYEAVKQVRPDVLYCSISGFGQTGPYRNRPGFDIMAQGVTGFMRMTGYPDGRPTKVGIAINDIAAGTTAVNSILAAELVRQRTGEGQYIDISLVDAGLAWTVWESGAYFGGRELPEPSGTRHRRSTPYQAYRTADGYVTIGANTQRLWERCVTDVLGREDWLADPRFADLASRMAHLEDLEAEIEAITSAQPTAYWIERLDAAGVPGGPVLRYDETLADPHIQAREMVVEIDHPVIGPMKSLGTAMKMSQTKLDVRRPAPWLGQHTTEVLREGGFEEAVIEDLYATGVVYDQARSAPARSGG